MKLLHAPLSDDAVETASVVLSPREGKEVAAVVDRLVGQLTSLDTNDLRSLQERLDMAFALAQWLREDVKFEASIDEIEALLDALENRLTENLPPETSCALEGAAKKASAVLAGCLAATR